MKRFLCILLCTIISIGAYSQKITGLRKCRNAYDEYYVEVTMFNNSYSHYIVCVTLAIQYINSYGKTVESTLTLTDTHFKPRANAYLNIFKKPEDCVHAKRLYVKRVIFDNGSYMDFK